MGTKEYFTQLSHLLGSQFNTIKDNMVAVIKEHIASQHNGLMHTDIYTTFCNRMVHITCICDNGDIQITHNDERPTLSNLRVMNSFELFELINNLSY